MAHRLVSYQYVLGIMTAILPPSAKHSPPPILNQFDNLQHFFPRNNNNVRQFLCFFNACLSDCAAYIFWVADSVKANVGIDFWVP